ncbi:MAG: amidohydrolase [Planctomycetota bacterium]
MWIVCFCLVSFPLFAEAREAETIYFGGPVLTMNDDLPQAEAVAVADGTILAVGDLDQVMQHRGERTDLVDLEGRTMVPGFVDSHGHAFMVGLQASVANLLPPPDGGVDSIDGLVETLTTFAAENPETVERLGWIVGFGYDNAQLVEQRHPTRDDLDRVSTDVPIVVIHQSSHLGSANSKALDLLGISADTPDPKGGKFLRRDGTNEPDGHAEEYAFFAMLGGLAGNFDDDVSDAFVERGTAMLASFGYTTAQEGRANADAIAAFRRVAARGDLRIDVAIYPDILMLDDEVPTREYADGVRIAGYKLTIDGSPQGKTAWLSRPYFKVPDGQPADYAGYAAITPEAAHAAIDKAFANDWQLLVHANGDAAIDTMIAGVDMARQAHPNVDGRPVLIHGQTLRHDQVAQLDRLDIFPSLYPMHTYYWGDYHRESVLGSERAENISPTGWVLDRGMRFGTHHDAPVALPDSMRVLSATVTRRSRSGDILGPQHRVDVMTALKAMTLWPAFQHFEEDEKGSIEPGKVADLVILSADPREVAEADLAGVKVLETIKSGRTIYTRDEQAALHLPPALGLFAHEPHRHDHAHAHAATADGCFSPAVDIILDVMDRD